jgi:hypothetical protein
LLLQQTNVLPWRMSIFPGSHLSRISQDFPTFGDNVQNKELELLIPDKLDVVCIESFFGFVNLLSFLTNLRSKIMAPTTTKCIATPPPTKPPPEPLLMARMMVMGMGTGMGTVAAAMVTALTLTMMNKVSATVPTKSGDGEDRDQFRTNGSGESTICRMIQQQKLTGEWKRLK